jgi:hypothetical protein
MRVRFNKGEQRRFLDLVLEKSNCPSLRSLISRGFDVNYSTLKSYYNENRTLPEEFFNQLCVFSDLKREEFEFEVLNENWGKIKGGRL